MSSVSDERIAAGTSTLHRPTPRLSDALRLLTDPDCRSRPLKRLNDPVLRRFWLDEYHAMLDRLRAEAISPILNKVGQFVTSRLVRDVIDTPRSSFSIGQAMNEDKVILVDLSQGKLGEDNATLLGAMLLTKIQLAAMNRVHVSEEKRRDFFLYVDEFQNFATDSFAKILSEARKYRLNLTLANQYVSQIRERTRKAIFGNCGSLVSFVVGAEDAGVLKRELSDQYSEGDLTSLGQFQVVNRMMVDNSTGIPFPAQTLSLDGEPTLNRAKVISVSGERYSTKREF